MINIETPQGFFFTFFTMTNDNGVGVFICAKPFQEVDEQQSLQKIKNINNRYNSGHRSHNAKFERFLHYLQFNKKAKKK